MKQEAGMHTKGVGCTKLEINITVCLEGRGADAIAEDDIPFRGEPVGLKRGSNKCFDYLNRKKEDLKIEQWGFF